MKTAFKILMILIVAGFLVWSFIGVDKKADDRLCQGVDLYVEDSLSLGMINKEEVLEIMKVNKMAFEGVKLADINMGEIERKLSNSPYIDTVSCAINAGGTLVLKVYPKVPALYVMPDKGEPYILDRKGSDMPSGNLSGNLCVATGKITKDFARKRLAPIACCLQDSAFWRAQVQQIEVVNDHDIRMYTRFADHVVLFGEALNMPDQLWRLRVFYAKGLSEIGWDKYESVSVAYDGIVIGKKPYDPHQEEEQFILPSSVPEVPKDSINPLTGEVIKVASQDSTPKTAGASSASVEPATKPKAEPAQTSAKPKTETAQAPANQNSKPAQTPAKPKTEPATQTKPTKN